MSGLATRARQREKEARTDEQEKCARTQADAVVDGGGDTTSSNTAKRKRGWSRDRQEQRQISCEKKVILMSPAAFYQNARPMRALRHDHSANVNGSRTHSK